MTNQLMLIDFLQRLMEINHRNSCGEYERILRNLGDDMKIPAFWIIRVRVLNWLWYVSYKAKKFVINNLGRN